MPKISEKLEKLERIREELAVINESLIQNSTVSQLFDFFKKIESAFKYSIEIIKEDSANKIAITSLEDIHEKQKIIISQLNEIFYSVNLSNLNKLKVISMEELTQYQQIFQESQVRRHNEMENFVVELYRNIEKLHHLQRDATRHTLNDFEEIIIDIRNRGL